MTDTMAVKTLLDKLETFDGFSREKGVAAMRRMVEDVELL